MDKELACDLSNPESPKDPTEAMFRWLEKTAGIPSEFFAQLALDSDWVFLIKWHAVLETCVNHMLTAHFKNPDLNDVFKELQMSNFKTGKMAFVKKCKLLSEKYSRFVQVLSEMRNNAVHEIKNFGFTFSAYLESITDKRKRANWLSDISIAFREEIEACGQKFSPSELSSIIPRTAIDLGCMLIAWSAFEKHTLASIESIEEKMMRMTYDAVIKKPALSALLEESNPKK